MSALFLKSCCRVCLVQEHIMIFLYDKVDEFNMSLSELLESCAGLKINNLDLYTKLICKECTEELLMVAKFREKCRTSELTLNELAQNLDADELIKLAAPEDDEDGLLVMEDFEPLSAQLPLTIDPTDDPIDVETQPAIDEDEGDDDRCQELQNVEDASSKIVEYIHETDAAADFITDNDDLFCQFIEEDAGECDDNEHQNDGTDERLDFEPDHYDEEPTGADTNETVADHELGTLELQSPVSVSPIKTAVINHNCECCGAGFMHLNNLRKHLQTHLDDGIGIVDDVTASETNELSSVLYECSTCTMMFTSSEEYAVHTESHRTEAEQSKTVSPPSLRSTQKSRGAFGQRKRSATSGIPSSATSTASDTLQNDLRKDHKCLYCSRTFASNSLLSTHVRIHTGERPYSCDQCPKTFATRGGLDLHVRRHLGIKPFECPFCQRRFVESSNLRVHMRTHTGEKPHQCNRCTRSFSRVFLLQIHQRTHSGERPYACDVCQKAFAQQGDLAAHKRIHTGERPHRCKVCGRGFIKSSALTPHMKMHERNASLEGGAFGGQTEESYGTDEKYNEEEYEDCGSEVLMIEEQIDGCGYLNDME